MVKSQANEGLNFRGHESPKTSGAHVTTDNLVDFVQARAVGYPVKKLQAITGLSKKQVENLRQGISGPSGVTLTRWIMNDPEFAGSYAEYVGLVRPGEAETAGALTRLVNAAVRQRGE